MIEKKGLPRNGYNDVPVPFIPRPLHTYIALHCTSKSAMVRANFALFFLGHFHSLTHPPFGLSSYELCVQVSSYQGFRYPNCSLLSYPPPPPILSLIVDRNCLFPSLCPARSLLLSYPSLQKKNPLTHSSQNSANPIPSTIIKKETLLFFRTLSTVNKQPQTQKKN